MNKKPKQSILKKAYNLTILPYAAQAIKKAAGYTIYPYAAKAIKKRIAKKK
tara:strand:+ start:1191 stop:1343 length:153 start_codon:yes stop_codon:yes gene_type:complete